MNRRQFLLGLGVFGLSSLSYAGYKYWPDAGLTNPCLSAMPDALAQHPLMQKIWDGIDASKVWDSHVHLVGTGDSASGVWFNPNMDSYSHPILKLQKQFYMNGVCAEDGNVDASTVERLLSLHAEMPAGYKSMLFAFDWYRDAQGRPLTEQSIFYVSNHYASKLAQLYPQYFEWVASIHPYRADAIDALEQAKVEGARVIKWLPSGMGIDPGSTKCDTFYKKAAQLDMPIISHTGRESAVQGGDQSFGNPLKMRRALDAGVRVVLAHCASDGEDVDLDHGNQRVKSFKLFERLMDAPEYQSLVFGEISAITLINHAWVIHSILARPDWHGRLLNGSDYPLPGIFPLINTRQLNQLGLLEDAHLPFLHALKQYNPLMFDFAVKRLMRSKNNSFANSVFETRKFFNHSHASSTS
ncbi:amidohydrolase family protein [Methylotenera sp. 1P/1]|uniref:amidohydrolase family protein n=1 Tax=Methylotenera sp. 1P/1 TaxID=1131551 RepID=UPI00036FD8E5|nr:hypothetical protein [Methylotenera sp. 1P/1]